MHYNLTDTEITPHSTYIAITLKTIPSSLHFVPFLGSSRRFIYIYILFSLRGLDSLSAYSGRVRLILKSMLLACSQV